MNLKQFLVYVGKVIVAHVVTYLILGAITYQITKQFYEGANPIFSTFMRTQAEPDLWRHVITWFIPGQILRGLLIAAVLYPFFNTLKEWDFWKRFFSIAGLYIVLGYWASTVAAPGTIDGMIYTRPDITLYANLLVQPEIVVQGLALSAWVAWWMAPNEHREAKFISDKLGPDRIQWRYDPLIVSEASPVSFHLRQFEKIATSLQGYTKRCYFSFAQFYKKINPTREECGCTTSRDYRSL